MGYLGRGEGREVMSREDGGSIRVLRAYNGNKPACSECALYFGGVDQRSSPTAELFLRGDGVGREGGVDVGGDVLGFFVDAVLRVELVGDFGGAGDGAEGGGFAGDDF